MGISDDILPVGANLTDSVINEETIQDAVASRIFSESVDLTGSEIVEKVMDLWRKRQFSRTSPFERISIPDLMEVTPDLDNANDDEEITLPPLESDSLQPTLSHPIAPLPPPLSTTSSSLSLLPAPLPLLSPPPQSLPSIFNLSSQQSCPIEREKERRKGEGKMGRYDEGRGVMKAIGGSNRRGHGVGGSRGESLNGDERKRKREMERDTEGEGESVMNVCVESDGGAVGRVWEDVSCLLKSRRPRDNMAAFDAIGSLPKSLCDDLVTQ